MNENVLKVGSGELVASISESIAERVRWLSQNNIAPKMAVVIASADAAVLAYAESKAKKAKQLGIDVVIARVAETSSQLEFEGLVSGLANDSNIHGILIELPVSQNFDAQRALELVPAQKDVDGLTISNLGLISQGREKEAICPATPRACIMLAEQTSTIDGAYVAVIGRGATVGRPLAQMLVNRNATVTLCHSRTKNLEAAVSMCEIVFTAVGKPYFLNEAVVKSHHRIIDAGISYLNDKLVGDFDPRSAGQVVSYTPVPGGVGPLTSVLIFDNLLKCIAVQEILK